MVRENKVINYSSYDELRKTEVIIWCCSFSGLKLLRELYYEGIKVIGFADSTKLNVKGTTFAGLPVFSWEELKGMRKCTICIATFNYDFQRQILDRIDQLENAEVYARSMVYRPAQYDTEYQKGIIEQNSNMIDNVKAHLADERSLEVFNKLLEYRETNNAVLLEDCFESGHKQYFPLGEIVIPRPDEVFVDAGAYDGMTSVQFVNWTNGNYKQIYAMEPDRLMKNILKGIIELYKIERVTIVESGAYSKSGTVSFIEDSKIASSRICEQGGGASINVTSIDEMLNGNEATYIKMDIEGAEMEALIGAHNTIKNFHPRLAISIYHIEDDLWKIPSYIIENYPFYEIYIRHYTNITTETIVYAVPK